MSSYSPLRWGFMGAGKIAMDFANAMKSLPNGEHEIVAVATSEDLDRAKEFAKKFKAKNAYGSYEELVQDPEVDVIYVNPLHPRHYACVKLCLNGGKPVLCEKPLGMNYEEVREMVELARQKNLFFMEAFWSRCFPIYDEIRKALKDGRIGQPKYLQGCFGLLLDRKDMARVYEKELGGSALLDFGSYLLMTTTLIFNGQMPESIHAWGKLNEEKVDIVDSISMKFKDDCFAQLIVTTEAQLPEKVVVYGTKGTLELPEWFNTPTKVIINGETIERPLIESKQEFFYPNSQGLAYEAQHVRLCLQNGLKQSPWHPLEHTEVIAKIMDEVRRQTGVTYKQDKQ